MCLIAFAIGASPHWPLVIASNRDEFLDRPTLPLARWATDAGQEVVSGRDLRAGGTWLGATPGGRIAFLTNVREALPGVAPLSRGALVTRWLESHQEAGEFAAELRAGRADYAGFNLVVGDIPSGQWAWMTNRAPANPASDRACWHAQPLPPGIYGLSNAALDTPWPKTKALKQALASALAPAEKTTPTRDNLQAALWRALADPRCAPAGDFPQTGVSAALESALSSVFVDAPERGYGTRTSTLLLAQAQPGRDGSHRLEVCLEEKTHLRGAACEVSSISNRFTFYVAVGF